MGAEGISPWELLLQEREFARSLETTIPKREIVTPFWHGLAVVLGYDDILTPLSEITEILVVPKIAKLKIRKPGVQGVSLYQGEIMMMIDLSVILEKESTPITQNSRVLVIKEEGQYIGCVVDKILGLKQVAASELRWEAPPSDHEKVTEHTLGTFTKHKVIMPVISVKSLVRSMITKDDS